MLQRGARQDGDWRLVAQPLVQQPLRDSLDMLLLLLAIAFVAAVQITHSAVPVYHTLDLKFKQSKQWPPASET